MSLGKVSGKLLGYDPEAVDALLDRIRRQYENPQSRIVTPGMLAVAKFDLVPAGYRIDEVDAALAKVADDFENREISQRLERIGKLELKRENRRLIGLIGEVLARQEATRFTPSRSGYRPKQLNQLLDQIRIHEGVLLAPEPMAIRTWELGRAKGGPNKLEVNEFLAQVVTALNTQRILG
jgi:DivIVA domain-containing protein